MRTCPPRPALVGLRRQCRHCGQRYRAQRYRAQRYPCPALPVPATRARRWWPPGATSPRPRP